MKSPPDREMFLTIKVSNYLAAGTVVWVVYPDERGIHIHRPNKGVTIYTQDSKLVSEDVLIGFELDVADIFLQDKN